MDGAGVQPVALGVGQGGPRRAEQEARLPPRGRHPPQRLGAQGLGDVDAARAPALAEDVHVAQADVLALEAHQLADAGPRGGQEPRQEVVRPVRLGRQARLEELVVGLRQAVLPPRRAPLAHAAHAQLRPPREDEPLVHGRHAQVHGLGARRPHRLAPPRRQGHGLGPPAPGQEQPDGVQVGRDGVGALALALQALGERRQRHPRGRRRPPPPPQVVRRLLHGRDAPGPLLLSCLHASQCFVFFR